MFFWPFLLYTRVNIVWMDRKYYALFIYQFWCKINLITVSTRNASSTTYKGEYIKHSHDSKEHNVIDDPHYNLQLLHQNVIDFWVHNETLIHQQALVIGMKLSFHNRHLVIGMKLSFHNRHGRVVSDSKNLNKISIHPIQYAASF